MSLTSRIALGIPVLAALSLAQDVRTATLVGAVTDPTGAAVLNASITVINVQTGVASHGQTNSEGSYYVPFLNIGQYEVDVEARGFKKFVRSGIVLQAGATTRIDVRLEVGEVTQAVEVTSAAPLLSTDTAVVGGIDDAKKIEQTSMLQSKPQHLMYYMEGAYSANNGTYHILGQDETGINYTIDGAAVKQSVRSAIGEVSTSITPPVDSIQEAQVWTTGIPAEVGHTNSGTYQMVTKSGTNQIHFDAEERYINKDFIYRSYFQQSVANINTAPFEYHNFDTVIGGPVYIPKVYDGRNKTFFFLGYRFDYDHEANTSTVSTPDAAMLGGNFAFGGLGFPIYDPKSIAACNTGGCPSSGYTATPFAGNQIPQSRIDPVAARFLSFNPYEAPNTAGFYSATGPNNNYSALTHYLSDRQGYMAKLDQQISNNDKLFVRYAWNRFRQFGRNNVQYAWGELDNAAFSWGEDERIDERNITLGEIHNVGPTLVNEFRFAYQRRDDNIKPALNGQNWSSVLGIPGISALGFPGFLGASGGSSVTWAANPSGTSNPSGNFRTLNDDFEIADNITKVHGTHTVKWGYQGILTREDDIAVTQPAGAYNFTAAGSGLPFTPNTGNTFASFLLGSVTSANFTALLANYLPRWGSHQFYVQDDWRAKSNLTVNIGLRWSYESPADTKWGYKSEFNPNTVDPLTGRPGAITHPKGTLYNAAFKNFAPRVGMSWNFKPNFVFRGSFDVFTVDVMPELGMDEYVAQATVQQPAGNPYPAFYLSQGPGPIHYNINGGTNSAEFAGTNYSSRTATYIDPNLRNPYVMTWSGGFQWQFKPNTVAELVYQGSAGIGLVPPPSAAPVNMNVLPESIYTSTNTSLLNSVYAATQNYLGYPQFGTINYISNYMHSTYHGLTARVEKRFNNGLSYNFLFTWSKNLSGTAGTGWQWYDWNLTKGPAANDIEYQFVSEASYDLPFGRGRRHPFTNGTGGYLLDVLFGGWTVNTIQSLRTGTPVTFTMAGSPYKYLPGETQPNIVPGEAINVPNYSVGPNLWPQSNQNPWFNIKAFSYPGAFTPGNAGVGIARAGGVWWPEYSIAKTWTYREKYKITIRADAHNLLPKTRAFLSPNTTVNITSPQTFGRFAPATGYSYSNWYTPNPNFQGILRIEF